MVFLGFCFVCGVNLWNRGNGRKLKVCGTVFLNRVIRDSDREESAQSAIQITKDITRDYVYDVVIWETINSGMGIARIFSPGFVMQQTVVSCPRAISLPSRVKWN